MTDISSQASAKTEQATPAVPKVEAFVNSLINLVVSVDSRLYNLHIPNGVSFEEAEWVCNEMAKLVMQLKQQNEAAKAAQPVAPEAVVPEVVS